MAAYSPQTHSCTEAASPAAVSMDCNLNSRGLYKDHKDHQSEYFWGKKLSGIVGVNTHRSFLKSWPSRHLRTPPPRKARGASANYRLQKNLDIQPSVSITLIKHDSPIRTLVAPTSIQRDTGHHPHLASHSTFGAWPTQNGPGAFTDLHMLVSLCLHRHLMHCYPCLRIRPNPIKIVHEWCSLGA